MCKRKTLKELTLKDNFMFGAVMSNENNCRRLLELILQIPIQKVEVCKEKILLKWLKLAAKAESVEQFQQNM